MSEEERDRVRALIDESTEVDHGETRIALSEDAVRAADRLGDERLRYDARMKLLEATIFGGYPEKALVAFSWLAAACDRDPEQFPESAAVAGWFLSDMDILWAYKWVVQNTHVFPQVTRSQITQTLDDMEARYRKNGISLRPVWMNRARIALALDGPGPEADEFFAQWQQASRDLYSDCAACEQHFQVEYHLQREQLLEALVAAGPLLSGELSCAEVPHITFVTLVTPLALAGERQRAESYFARGYELCRGNRDFLEVLAELLEYAVWTGKLEVASEMARNHAEWLGESRVAARRLPWFVGGAELFERLGDDALPELVARFGNAAGIATESASALAAELRRQADDVAASFDRRNGNALVSGRLARTRVRLRDPSRPT